MGYTRADLAGVSIPDDLMRTIRICEDALLGTVDLEGEIIRLLQNEQSRRIFGRGCDQLDLLKQLARDATPDMEIEELKHAWSVAEARAAMRAEEARRLSLRQRLGAPRVVPTERRRRRVCQLSNAWMVAE